MQKNTIQDRGHIAVTCIEGAWKQLQKGTPELPAAVIVLLPAGARNRKLGHFAPLCWRYNSRTAAHEIAIHPGLFIDPAAVLHVLVHEAAHALNFARGVRDCSGDRNEYHRVAFRITAQALGLACAFRDTRYGWTCTRFPDEGIPARYQALLRFLQEDLPQGTQQQRQIAFPRGTRTPMSGHVRLECRCPVDARRSIYANRTVLKEGGVRCDLCKGPFTAATSG